MKLDPLKTSNSPAYDAAADYLAGELKEHTAGTPSAGAYLASLTQHIKVIVCNLHAAAYPYGPGTHLAVQLGRSAYKTDPRQQGFQFGYTNVKRVYDFLLEQEYIESRPASPGTPDRTTPPTKIVATPKLMDLLASFGADAASVYRDVSSMETVVLKGKKKGKPPKREILATPDTPGVRAMRHNMRGINEVLQATTITLDYDEYDLYQLEMRLSSDPGKYTTTVDFTCKTLYRVFVDVSLTQHGRIYGGWWQNISSDDRRHILINGAPTVELDYSSMHPFILYGLARATPPPGDLYSLPGQPGTPDMRDLVKRFMLISLNAASSLEAVRALRRKYDDKGIVPPMPITKATMEPIIQQLREKHPAIQHHFCSGAGNMLMHHDSEIAEAVLLHFARQGIPCLPIHDSFIVGAQHADECRQVMGATFRDRYDIDIPIKQKPAEG